MSIKSLLGLTAAGILLAACQSDSYRITGVAEKVAEGDTVCMCPEGLPMETAVIKERKFEFRGKTDTIRLCTVYRKQQPESGTTFFLEADGIRIELNEEAGKSRVAGTKINNEWQALQDEIAVIAQKLHQITTVIQASRTTTLASQASLLHDIDSLNNEMKNAVKRTAARNQDNDLGHFIAINYTEE